MNITTEVVTDYSIDDIFEEPWNYIDCDFDLPIVKIWNEGTLLFTVLVGVEEDDDSVYYISLEDDEISETFYPAETHRPAISENLWDVYERAIDDWMGRLVAEKAVEN